MSSMLFDLIGERCSIKNDEDDYVTGDPAIACRVVDADDEWLKVTFVDEEGNRLSRLVRTETVESVTVFED